MPAGRGHQSRIISPSSLDALRSGARWSEGPGGEGSPSPRRCRLVLGCCSLVVRRRTVQTAGPFTRPSSAPYRLVTIYSRTAGHTLIDLSRWSCRRPAKDPVRRPSRTTTACGAWLLLLLLLLPQPLHHKRIFLRMRKKR